MFGKIKKILLQKKALIIALAALAIIGWLFAIYFGINLNRAKEMVSTNCLEKLEKINAYSNLLDKSNKLVRQQNGLESLESDVYALNNGTLYNIWKNVVLGGNKKEDLNDYFDTIIDSLILFSK